jgi:hypothetical protein
MRGSLTFFISLFLFGLTFYEVKGQATLEGMVIDGQRNEPLPGVDVILIRGGQHEAIRETNASGEFRVSGLEVGTYSVEIRYIGFMDTTFTNINLRGGIQREVFQIFEEGVDLEDFLVVERRIPLIELDQTTSGRTIDRERISSLPTRSINQMAALSGGTYSPDGGTPNIRGQRSDGTIYFIDGVRARGLIGIPQSAMQQITTQIGGIPARYGDATGGIISITTRGPAEKFSGGAEAITSQFLDPYGYNNLDFHVTGPLLKREMDDGRERTVLGYFFAADLGYRGDYSPQGFGIHRLRDEYRQELEEDPIAIVDGSFVPRAELTTFDNVEEIRRRDNSDQWSMNFSGRLDYSITDQVNIRFGGQYGRRDRNVFDYNASLFAPERNPMDLRNTYRGYVRFNQRFDISPDENRRFNIEEAYYNIHLDVNYQDIEISNREFRDDIFKYGHIGQFDVYRVPTYTWETRNINGKEVDAYYMDGFQDTLVTFDPHGEYNQTTANYTQRYFERSRVPVRNKTQIRLNNALLNADQPPLIYSTWLAPGSFYPVYQSLNELQVSVNAHGAITIEGHELSFGVQYEERQERMYVVGGGTIGINSLWNEARGLVNSHFDGLDTDNPIMVRDEHGVFQDTVKYNRNVGTQTHFDKQFRDRLIEMGATDEFGRPIDDFTEINIDRYDPGMFSIDMFSPRELFRQGSGSLVNYYGYDHTGRQLTREESDVPFFEDGDVPIFLDGSGNLRGQIAPFRPSYAAAYIQDKFSFRDLIFNIGLRIDQYNVNQPVLADPYSLYPIRTVSEVRQDHPEFEIPGNIGGDYKVYANRTSDPLFLTGFRDGNRWYDASGNELRDPSTIANASGGSIQPYLSEGGEVLRDESFTDFEPTLDLLPRIAFSFPISERSSFSANYDVLTQRPRGRANTTIDNYYFLENRATLSNNNSALRPEKSINYELGFRQMVGVNSAIRIQAFYREIRDLIQITEFTGAYPISYRSFENIDFGTVKGLTFGYEFRPIEGNFFMDFNYTLQFADGTGSSQTTQSSLIAVGQPNLRTPVPLDFDVRHNIITNFQYGFGSGPRYTGPVTDGGFEILGNTSLNVTLSAISGEPYSRQSNVTQSVSLGVAQRSSLEGDLNSARLPWQFNADARLSRAIPLQFGRRGGEDQVRDPRVADAPSRYNLNIYLMVSNIFDIRNISNVYRYTGSPDDDGFITSPEGIQQADNAISPQAFQDLYSMKVTHPFNYYSPRTIRLGAVFSF